MYNESSGGTDGQLFELLPHASRCSAPEFRLPSSAVDTPLPPRATVATPAPGSSAQLTRAVLHGQVGRASG
eukprot:COSAG02_NODE_19359_length_885_cov_2.321883_1_plen_70_part_10